MGMMLDSSSSRLLIPVSSVASRSAALKAFSATVAPPSLNRVNKTAGQCLEAGAGIVLAGDENDVTEIVQKNGIGSMPEMHGDLLTVRHLNSAKIMNGLSGVVAKIPVHGSSDDVLLHGRVDQHVVFDKTA